MSDQRPPSNPWVELWKTTVSGAVAICSAAACAAIVFAGLAFTHGGAQISYHDLNITLPFRDTATPPPAVPPTPPPVLDVLPPPPAPTPIAHLAIPYLGIFYRETTLVRSEAPGLVELTAARVMAVRPNTPAERVALQPGDTIVAVDGRPLVDGLDLRNRVRGANVGQEITLHLYRDDRLLRIPVALGELPVGEE